MLIIAWVIFAMCLVAVYHDDDRDIFSLMLITGISLTCYSATRDYLHVRRQEQSSKDAPQG